MKTIMTWVPMRGTAASPRLASKMWFWLSVFGVSVFAVHCFLGSNLLRDADTYWHIAAGQWIVAHRAVPTTDPFSFSFHGAKWVTHEWLAEVLLYACHTWLGWSGLVALTALCISATVTMVLRFLLRYLEPLHALTGTLLAYLTLMSHLLARPHLLAWPLMVIWMAGLARAHEERRAPSLWLLPVMLVWANLHASFILGLGFAVAFAGEAILERGTRLQAVKSWGLFLVLAALLTLVTPSGVDGVLYPFQVTSMDFALKVITEWQPPNFRKFEAIEVWLAFMFFGALYFGFRLPLSRIVMTFGLIHLALTSARYGELLGLVAPFVVVPFIGPQLRAAIRPEVKPSIPPRALYATAAACCALLIAGIGYLARGIDNEQRVLPRNAVAAALKAGASGPVFNAYDFGGYLIFSGIAPLIDGRADMYGDDFMRRFFKAYSGDTASLKTMLQDYKIGWALLEPESAAVARFDELPNWRKVYADKVSVAFVRNN